VLALALVLTGGSVAGQDIEWNWGAQSVGRDNVQVLSSKVDQQGNTYLAGWFVDSVAFGSTQLISHGRSDLFVAKLTPKGEWAWALAAGSEETDRAAALVVDKRGRVFVAGSFSKTMHLGKNSLTSLGDWDCFVAEINKNGSWSWAQKLGGTAYDEATALTLGRPDELILGGRFQEVARAGTHQLISVGQNDGFVAKLSKKGAWKWTTALGGAGEDAISAMAAAETGELYVTGRFHGTAHLDSLAGAGQHPGVTETFVLKLDADGKRQWLAETAGNSTVQSNDIAVNAAHEVFITGRLSGQVTFGGATVGSRGGDDAFVARLNSEGKWVWITSMGADLMETGVAIAINQLGNACVAGTFQRPLLNPDNSLSLRSHGGTDVFIIELTPRGEQVGALAIGGEADDTPSGLAIDAAGQYHLSGSFGGTLQLGSNRLESPAPQVFTTSFLLVPFGGKRIVNR
jgi:hypothetical protein